MNKHGVASVLGLTVASVLGLTLMTRPAVAFGADTALILGGTGLPVPPQSYVDEGVPVSSTGGIIKTLTRVVSNDIAVVRPLVDTAVAIGASLPKYDAQLFTSQLRAGHLLNAVGMPIAADVALVPYALIVGAVFPIVGAAATTVTQLAELAGLEPTAGASTVDTTAQPAVSTSTANAQPVVSTSAGANATNAPTIGADPASTPATRVRHGRGRVDWSSAMSAVAGAFHQAGNSARSNGKPSKPGPIANLRKAITGSAAHAHAVTAVARLRAGSGVTGTSGSTDSAHNTAGTGSHRAHR